MTDVEQQHFNTGWNDLAHGILEWKDGSNDKYNTPLDWALAMYFTADIVKPTKKHPNDQAYYSGVMAAIDEYRKNGKIEKKTPPKAV